VGGVRIFPVAPAPAPAKPQVKVLFLDFSIVVEKVKKTKFYFRVLCVFAFFYSFYLILFLKIFCHFLNFQFDVFLILLHGFSDFFCLFYYHFLLPGDFAFLKNQNKMPKNETVCGTVRRIG
jgi:hypothetical protein